MLTKDSFLLTHIFLCYQTLENTENYIYTRFFIETNRALASGEIRNPEEEKYLFKNLAI